MSKTTLTVAVIGAGPGGMFFIHALEQLRNEASESKKTLPNNIEVTCFEKSSNPCGIWRSCKSSNTTDMYEDLWANGCTFSFEFYDYTLLEHFNGKPTTVYVPRQDVYDYITARVTKNCPNFFDRFVRFNSEVVFVKYLNNDKKFIIQIRDLVSDTIRTEQFDKCIWACGENGKPKIPQQLVDIFSTGGFEGRMIHSSETLNLKADVKDNRVLIIGGAYSAEDITLQSIKLGVSKVYVCTRVDDNEITFTTKWPANKVVTLLEQEPMSCINDGRTILFREVEWTFNGYKNFTNNEVSYELNNIDTIIFCTGYDQSLNFLDDSLQQGYPGREEYFSNQYMFDAPKNWKMKPGFFTELTGEVTLSSKLRYLQHCVHPNFFRGVLIDNPNMMFLSIYASDYPLLALDTYARLFALYVTGLKDLPSQEEMRKINLEQAFDMLHYPYARMLMDENYYEAVDEADIWPEDTDIQPEEWNQAVHENVMYGTKMLAWVMKDAEYPLEIGDRYELNDKGKRLVEFGQKCVHHRYVLGEDEDDWKTFRDYSNGHEFQSLYTSTKAVTLPKKWLDIKDNSVKLVSVRPEGFKIATQKEISVKKSIKLVDMNSQIFQRMNNLAK